MGGLFSKSKKPVSRLTDQDKAVLLLKKQRDKLKQHQKKIELSLERQREMAKKLLAENKRDEAKLLLKKKRYLENILQKTEVHYEKVEQLTHDLEFAQLQAEILDGLKDGNTALKSIHEMLNVHEIEKILNETREGIEKQQEIDELISGKLTEEDDEAIEAELEEMLDIKIDLPAVPTDDLPERAVTPENKQKEKSNPQKIAMEA